MIDYLILYQEKLLKAFFEHLEIVFFVMLFSLLLATVLTFISMYFMMLSKFFLSMFSVIYSIPSLAMFAMMIPLTGLGKMTAILVLTVYNQYLLLNNFIVGLKEVDPSIVDAATGMGMTRTQILLRIRIPLSLKPIFAGIRLAAVFTIGVATIAAAVNAGGLGTILFDGLRTMNAVKILWGGILSSGLAITANSLLGLSERRITKWASERNR